jgi:hypothetical protein
LSGELPGTENHLFCRGPARAFRPSRKCLPQKRKRKNVGRLRAPSPSSIVNLQPHITRRQEAHVRRRQTDHCCVIMSTATNNAVRSSLRRSRRSSKKSNSEYHVGDIVEVREKRHMPSCFWCHVRCLTRQRTSMCSQSSCLSSSPRLFSLSLSYRLPVDLHPPRSGPDWLSS